MVIPTQDQRKHLNPKQPTSMKIAAYNLNNMFERAKVFELQGMSKDAKPILDAYYGMINLLSAKSYSGKESKIIDLIKGFVEPQKGEERYITINQMRNKLYSKNPKTKKITLKVNGRAEWVGWVELVKKEVNEEATKNTAKVIEAVAPDVLCCVEVENRTVLEDFNRILLKNRFKYSMLIDGNDPRGIDVGLYSNYPFVEIHTHIFDSYKDSQGREHRIFSRDCAEYAVDFNGNKVTFLCNHFKSQGYGTKASNDKRRLLQAERVKDILKKYDLTKDLVVVAGDLNDTPDNPPVQPLTNHPNLENIILRKGHPQGTYLKQNKQFDYLLVSKALAAKYKDSGVERRGIFKAVGGSFPTVTSEVNQASDHAAVWAEFDI